MKNDAMTDCFLLWESKGVVGIDTVRQGWRELGVMASFRGGQVGGITSGQ